MRELLFAIAFILGLAPAGAALAQAVQGSGSTFAFPILSKWSHSYQYARADGGDFVPDEGGIEYEPIGSLGGFLRLAQPEIDFAATEAPVSPEELERRGLAQFPIVIGGIVPVLNLDGIGPGEVKLTGELLADIYLGKIQDWSDPAIKSVNPGLKLPGLRIRVIHRKDGSGSTLAWTRFLSAASAEWKSKYGADTLVSWPLGTGVEGSRGVVQAVVGTRGAIGYVEYGQVSRAPLRHARVRNREGRFVEPGRATFQAAGAGADWAKARDFHLSLIDAPGAEAYPITTATFIVMHRTGRSGSRTMRTLRFFQFALEKGSADAAALGYVPLPGPLVSQVKGYWKSAFDFGS